MTSMTSGGLAVAEPAGAQPRASIPRRGLRSSRKRQLTGLAMASPAIVLIVGFFVIPLVMTFWISLHNWPLLGKHRFIGLDNYTRALKDPGFATALKFTLIYTVVITPILFVLGLALALIVRRRVRAARTLRRTSMASPSPRTNRIGVMTRVYSSVNLRAAWKLASLSARW